MTLYSSQACGKCKVLKEWLVSNDVKFKEVDLGADSEMASKVVAKSGSTSLPQALVKGKIYVGVSAIKEAVNV